MSVEMVELVVKAPEPVRPAGILQQNRVFLDFFWDLAKPDQEVRLKAVEDLIQYLRSNNKADELEYTFKRLVDGLAHTRETARPGFSLALGQVLSAFEEVSLQTILNRIKEKHSLQKVKKKLIRNALFGNLFGVLALHQSSRLSKEPQVVLGCVQLLQSLSQHRQHLKDLPSKTMMDILTEIPEEVFEEVLLSALQTDLASAFSTPEQMQLLLVALQRFPQTLKPKKLKKLLGSTTIINADNIPKLTEVLKKAAHSVKKECVLPAVVLDLLKLSLKEDSFQLFWNKAIVEGMLKQQSGPTHYLSFRLLGSALPLLSVEQLKEVLSGDVMTHYGEHVVSAQKPDRFKLAPEMDTYVSDFLQNCQDSEKQLVVMVAFSSLTNMGYPVVPSVWRVVQHLQPAALQDYVDWLKSMFVQPQLDKLLDFSTRKQKDNQEGKEEKENSIFRLRKWIVSRLTSIIDNHHVKKQEDLVMDVARFVFFHALFSAKKASADVAETKVKLSVPIDEKTRGVLVTAFFGLLLSMHHLHLPEDSAEGAAVNQKRAMGVTADGTMWIYHLVQYAQVLLTQPKSIQSSQPFSPEQRQAWDRGMSSGSNQQEQDFLRRAADIFRNQLCRSKVYCKTVGDRQGELHDLLDKMMSKTQKLSDSSVGLYYFSASLYVVKVLRGAPPAADAKEEQTDEKAAENELSFTGNMDMDRVSAVFREALTSFMSRRKSPLTTQMFTDLFNRFPVLCVNLLDTAVQHITSGVREHQQGQACVLVLRAMQSREVQKLLSDAPWNELCVKVAGQLTASLQQLSQTESKVVREKVVKILELGQFLVKHVQLKKLPVNLEPLQNVLQLLSSVITFKKTGKLEDTYWAVVKHFGVMKPKVEKTKPEKEADKQPLSKKKKGFLPETKKRNKRKQLVLEQAANQSTPADKQGADKGQAKKKHDKKAKQKRPADGTRAPQPIPAKKSKTQSESQPAKKKTKKPKQKKVVGGQM
ncbi:putative myb-binding protein 1A isoform 3 [Scophthalmus maximus]|uniref:Putative myb-binding protein 1A isoform 3 n=1 Tax=Scophthalmus maximus TaxID=52904 RepID=A0A2U9B8A3_SCOMX|nr:putative myb-binding protein 1A isoform 3 [Scophthalmus maximus]